MRRQCSTPGGKKISYGFNAASEEYMDMIEAGIIDPTKVTRTALQNAASIAGLMITTECVIADKPEEDKKMPGGMGGGDMYQERHRSGAGGQCPSPAAVAAGHHGPPIPIQGRVPGDGDPPLPCCGGVSAR